MGYRNQIPNAWDFYIDGSAQDWATAVFHWAIYFINMSPKSPRCALTSCIVPIQYELLIVKLTPAWPLLQKQIKSSRLSSLFFVFSEDFHRPPGSGTLVCMRQESLNCFWAVVPYSESGERTTFNYSYRNKTTEQCISAIYFPLGGALISTENQFTVLWCEVGSRSLGDHPQKPASRRNTCVQVSIGFRFDSCPGVCDVRNRITSWCLWC